MGTIDLDDAHVNDFTVGEIITTLIKLDPAIRLIDAYRSLLDSVDRLEKIALAQGRLNTIIIRERDDALLALKERVNKKAP